MSKGQSIGENIRYYRKQKGFTQQELAEKTEFTDKYISLLERDQRKPSTECLEKIADALSVSIEDLTSKNSPEQRRACKMVQFIESYVRLSEEVRETLIAIINKELEKIKET